MGTISPIGSQIDHQCNTNTVPTNAITTTNTQQPPTTTVTAPITVTEGSSQSSTQGTSTCSVCNCSASLGALGFVVALLLVTLATVTTGWMWTCWIMKNRVARKGNQPTQVRYSEPQLWWTSL